MSLGQVHWYDTQSQEGMIKVNNRSIFYCNPNPKKKVFLKDFRFMKVEVYTDISFEQVLKLEELTCEERDILVSDSLIDRLDFIEKHKHILSEKQKIHLEWLMEKEIESNL